MKVKIFEKTWTSGLSTLEREINNFFSNTPARGCLEYNRRRWPPFEMTAIRQ
jgi:hypothetical protein